MRQEFANVPDTEGCVLLAFTSEVIHQADEYNPNEVALEVFKLTYLNRLGFVQTYQWFEERY
jgi:hypothetical protein